MIKIYQKIYKTDFDHCGIIICDNFGVPYVYEKTPFTGYKIRTFEQRIINSQSRQILVIPLNYNSNVINRQNLNNFISTKIANKNALESIEFINFTRSIFYYIFKGNKNNRLKLFKAIVEYLNSDLRPNGERKIYLAAAKDLNEANSEIVKAVKGLGINFIYAGSIEELYIDNNLSIHVPMAMFLYDVPIEYKVYNNNSVHGDKIKRKTIYSKIYSKVIGFIQSRKNEVQRKK